MSKLNLETLKQLEGQDLFNWLEGISDHQAENSDVGGDSDADDETHIATTPRHKISKRLTNRNTPISSPGPSNPKVLEDINNTPTTSKGSRCGLFDNQDYFLSKLAGILPSRQRRNPDKKITYFDKNNDGIDFDSDDSIRDPNYEDTPQKERLFVQAEIDNDNAIESDIDYDEFLGNDDVPSDVPANPYDFSKRSSEPKKYLDTTFTETCGPLDNNETASPMALFEKTFGIATLELMVNESNLYATQNGKNLNLTLEELKAFIGILIIMGFHRLPSIRHYWLSDDNFRVSRIANLMPQKRFLFILRFLHLNNNETMPKRGTNDFDKLYKVRPLLTKLNVNFKALYVPHREMAIDESMVGFKGRTTLKQYMPMKPTKRGFKVWVLACSATGYMISFQIYQGKEKEATQDTLGERVVMEMSEPYWRKGYCLYFDNFFTTFNLLKVLMERGTFACGTFRVNRKHYPKSILMDDKNMRIGDSDFAQAGDISVVKWKDRGKKSVNVVSNMHNPTKFTTVKRTNKTGERQEIKCPESIAAYNKYMGAVDKFDQAMAAYAISWKSRRWWVKLLYYFVDSAIVNAFILHKYSVQARKEKPCSQLKFRTVLANELIGTYNTRKRKGPAHTVAKKFKKIDGRGVSIEDNIRRTNVGEHLPIKGTSRRCGYCSTQKNSKRSQMQCRKCSIALCLDCFVPFHEA